MGNRGRVPLVLLVVLLSANAFIASAKEVHVAKRMSRTWYFDERNWQGWSRRAMDLDLADFTIPWSIERSSELFFTGPTSVKFYLDNLNDKGKIWIERAFAVKRLTPYSVTVKFQFATQDWGDANHFALITGALPNSPKVREDIISQEKGLTSNGYSKDIGYVWLPKEFIMPVTSNEKGKLYVIVGVWGIWETARTYYVDSLSVTIGEGGSPSGVVPNA